MCGIVAMVGREQPLQLESLERAVLSLRHRGPDARHCWLAPQRHVALGHARLSVIDLTTGDQPIANEDGSLRLVVNGEFYDYERHRRELAQRGHCLSTQSDSEIALHLYEERGTACLENLRGEFAFALWDEQQQTLFAARDRFGIKPLFYTLANGALLVASEAKALAAAGATLQWDRPSVYQSLFACVGPDRTLFSGVRQVPPGHYLLATRDSLRVVRYWDVDYPAKHRTVVKFSAGEWIGQLRAHVEESVRLRMRADVPVGCLLSGGLDSSAALGLAQRNSTAPVHAFTIAFDHPDYDESVTAGETAARAGAIFHPLRVTNADFAAHFADAVWHAEAMHVNAHGAARYLLSRAVRDAGCKVVLAGEGADELGAGYHFCERALQVRAQSPLWRWPRLLGRLLQPKNPTERLIAGTSPDVVRAARLLGFPASMLDYVAGKIGVMRGLLHEDFAGEFARHDPYGDLFRQLNARRQLAGREPVKQVLYLWLKTFFANYVLAGERMDMAHAVELRLPFLDHHLFEFARQIPGSLFLREGRQKWVLREAMQPFVQDQVYRGRKQPFMAPPSALQEGSALLELVQDTLRSEAAAAVPFFDRQAVLLLLDRLPVMTMEDRTALDPVLLMMLSLAVLHDRYRL